MSATADVIWDGVTNAYIPGPELHIDPSLELHTEVGEVDPFTYEVIRHNLWNTNDEHGSIMLRVSGSPIANVAEDFQTAILTEDAEVVFFGPRIQTLGGTFDLAVQWILENRSANPGITEGDIFLCNDPWIGATHQQDVGLYAPVFWKGKLFCWVANSMHQYDIGGSTPGGFCPDATDTFMEAVSIPPIKIIENGRYRHDIEQFYLRHSRMPDMVALDLRAQVAGCVDAKRRITVLLERYGAEVVKGVMHKILDDGEATFASRLALIEDGIWRARSYLEVAIDGDRGVYPVELQAHKTGEELTFRMEGTHEQVGALNIGFSCWRSGVLTAVNPMLCYDLLYATGGPIRRMRFEPIPGTILCATRPASVSNAQISVSISGALASSAMSRMISASAELADEAFAPGATSVFPIDSLAGINQRGEPYGTILLDPMLGGTGAFYGRDGMDTGGIWYNPRSLAPNVEDNEFNFPVLYLYRREWQDSGGAGRYRGGNSAEFAFVAHRTGRIDISTASAGVALPTSEGVFGGHPASPSRHRFRKGSDIQQMLSAGEMPQSFDAVGGEEVLIGPKQRGIVQGEDDVMELAWCAGGGIGDPVERDPALVAADVARGAVSATLAENVYGVVVRDGALDPAATEQRRAAIVTARLNGAEPTRSGDPSWVSDPGLIGGVLRIVDEGAGARALHCGGCGVRLAGPGESYKDASSCYERPVQDVVRNMADPVNWVDGALVLREYTCPSCAKLLTAEVARAVDGPLVDIELTPP